MTHDHQTKHTIASTPDPLARGGWVGAHWPGTLMEVTGMEVLEHTAARTVISMPIDGNRQSAGILHGGASAALAETAASFAAQIHARETNPGKQAYAVGTELNASHIAAGRSGIVTAMRPTTSFRWHASPIASWCVPRTPDTSMGTDLGTVKAGRSYDSPRLHTHVFD